MSNTLNPYNTDLFRRQIEPSRLGGKAISQLLGHIIQDSDVHDVSHIYSTEFDADKETSTFEKELNEKDKTWRIKANANTGPVVDENVFNQVLQSVRLMLT